MSEKFEEWLRVKYPNAAEEFLRDSYCKSRLDEMKEVFLAGQQSNRNTVLEEAAQIAEGKRQTENPTTHAMYVWNKGIRFAVKAIRNAKEVTP